MAMNDDSVRSHGDPIPNDWCVSPIKERVNFANGKAHEHLVCENGRFVVVNSKFISSNGLVVKYSNTALSLAKRGDILMVMSDVPNGKAVAKCFVVGTDSLYTANQRICIIRSTTDNSQYLYFKLNRNPYFLAFDDGVKQTNLRKQDILGCSLEFPPTRAEQEAIAGALSDADTWIESLEQLIAKKRQIKQGAMQELLTGKRRLAGFDGEWQTRFIGEVASVDPENLGSDTKSDFAFKYISLEDVDTGTLRSWSEHVFHSAPSRARRRLRVGDVLVSTVRPNLMSHYLFNGQESDWVCSTGFCVLRCMTGITHPYFVFAQMFSGNVNSQINALLTGSNYPAINSRDVAALRIAAPSYAEQSAITSIVCGMDSEIVELETKLAKARLIKQAMMQELLTGRIRLVQPTASADRIQKAAHA